MKNVKEFSFILFPYSHTDLSPALSSKEREKTSSPVGEDKGGVNLFNTSSHRKSMHRAQIGKRRIGVIQLVIFP